MLATYLRKSASKRIAAAADDGTLAASNTGESNTGESNAGESNAGESNAGESNAGECNAGESNAGESNPGERTAGERDENEPPLKLAANTTALVSSPAEVVSTSSSTSTAVDFDPSKQVELVAPPPRTAVPTEEVLQSNSEEIVVEDGGTEMLEAVGDSDDVEYEVEKILAMQTFRERGRMVQKFHVSWVGYEERTWEPEENLPNDMVSAFVNATAVKAKAASEKTNDHTRCAACGDGPDGLGSVCIRCKKPMHHFCATDVCQSLGLKDANGVELVEFPNDTCYCSKACYDRRVGSVRAAKRKRVRYKTDSDFDDDASDGKSASDDDEDTVNSRKRSRATTAKTSRSQHALTKKISVSETKKASRSVHMEDEDQWPPRKPKQAAQKTKAQAEPAKVRERDPRVGKMVAFCADKEDWMPFSMYKEVKGLYLSGRIHKSKSAKGEKLKANEGYEVRWTVTQYQKKNYIHRISGEKVDEGIANHSMLTGSTLNNATWRHICQVPESEAQPNGENLDDYVILDGTADRFVSQQILPPNLELVEQITSLDFQPSKKMRQPADLFTHPDGTTETKLIKEKRHHFETASSSFFAYLPLAFWNTVVAESNKYAAHLRCKAITLDEMMKFWGIMFYTTVVDKGEYSNYWGNQVEDEIFGVSSTTFGLESVMTLKRFQFIRKNLCFRFDVSEADLKKDPVARIRPLLNILKHTCTKYVVVGRNVAVDESSIACRSKYGRHLIVFNSSKPTGKFHFKIYACCCATTWLMVGFRLHCSSEMEDRLRGVISPSEARAFDDRLQFSSNVRRIVLEVTRALHNSGRIVNTDNFYTSVTLLLSLREVGMYGRGTIRENSAHFPKAHMFAKKADEPRGSSLQGVSNTGEMLAASWMDGSAVNILSNADSSDMDEVTRLIGKRHIAYPAPTCLAEYNKYMQGVDRLDQLRAKYSLADGHSMKKWHKKLALAFIDMARVNAYVTKCMRVEPGQEEAKSSRNEHRQFMIELASELITGKWKDHVEDDGMLFTDEQLSTASVTSSPVSSPSTSTVPCSFVLSKTKFPTATRGKRGCKVCAFEGRPWTMNSIYCSQHNVCLCTKTYPMNERLASVVCPRAELSCWQKFHEHYFPKGVFNQFGRIKRTSKIFKERQALMGTDTSPQQVSLVSTAARRLSSEIDAVMPPLIETVQEPESPPTLVFSPFDINRANSSQPQGSPDLLSPRPVATPAINSTASHVSFQELRSPNDVQSTSASDDFASEVAWV